MISRKELVDAQMTSNAIKSIKTLLMIILFVYADILCENFIVIVNDQEPHFVATFFLFAFLILQIIFAPLQSGFSDFLGRRKSLIISLAVSLVSLICVFFYIQKCFPTILLLIFAIIGKGFWGNTIPISFAAIADTQDKNYRGSFALASSTYSLAFITLVLISYYSFSDTVLIYFVMAISFISLIVCIFRFKDTKDTTAHFPYDTEIHKGSKVTPSPLKIGRKEVFLITKELIRPLTRKALSAYVLWEISMYAILISQVDFNPKSSQTIALLMMVGYLTGIFILRLKRCYKIKDRTIITWGYYTSFFSLVPYFMFFSIIKDITFLLGLCYYFHALGNAFLSPALLSILAKGRSSHDQGKILGLVESADTIAFLVGTMVVMIYLHFHLPLFTLIAFSFLSFTVSWGYYGIFNNLTKLRKLER